MGNIASTGTPNTTTPQITNSGQQENKSKVQVQSNPENELIDQIVDTSIELLRKYNDEFLREEFCYDVAFVMEDKLNQANIKVLRDIGDKINNAQPTPELKMILQHQPTDNEKFFIEGFEKQLADMFWNRNLQYDPSILQKEGVVGDESIDLTTMELFKDKNKTRYIDFGKVNELIRDRQLGKRKHNNAMDNEELEHHNNSSNSTNLTNNPNNVNKKNKNKNNNPEEEKEEEVKTGGANTQVNLNTFKRKLEEGLKAKGLNSEEVKKKMLVQLNNSTLPPNRIKQLKESLQQSIANAKNNKKGKNNENATRESIEELVVTNLERRINNKQRQNNVEEAKIAESKNNSVKPKSKLEVVIEKNNSQKTNNKKNKEEEALRNSMNSKIKQQMEVMKQVVSGEALPTNSNKKQTQEEQKPSNNKNKQQSQQQQTTTNSNKQQTPNNKNRKNKLSLIDNQGMIRYGVPKEYKTPTEFCLSGVEKCSLSKKDLCKVITENIIVRCNIIAAILSVLPSKKSKNGKYYGGYLYSKFLNLGTCQVCVPKNYQDLKKLSPLQLVKHVAQYADFMDFKSCKDNGGYYLKLNDNQIKALYDNVPKEGEQGTSETNYNSFYVDCAENLKNTYFDNLKVLLDILIELKNNPFINNDILNQIGLKTKEIIDKMYHLCQYYYIYAIVSLLNAKLEKVGEDELKLQQSFAKMLKKPTKVST